MDTKYLKFVPFFLLFGFADAEEKVAGAPDKFSCSATGDHVSEVDFLWPTEANRFTIRMTASSFTHDEEYISLGTIFIRRPDKDNFIAIRMSPADVDEKMATVFFQTADEDEINAQPIAVVPVEESVLFRVHQDPDGTVWLNIRYKNLFVRTFQFPPNMAKNGSIRLACSASDIVFEEMDFSRSIQFEN